MAEATTSFTAAGTLPGGNPLRLLRDVTTFIGGYVVICAFVIGVFGNLFSLVIFIRVRQKHDATSLYLGYLAVTDTFCIVLVGVRVWLAWGLKLLTRDRYFIDYFTLSLYGCKCLKYLSIVSQCLSAWIIVIFSLERALVVCFPFRRSAITARRRWFVIGCMTSLVSMVSTYSPILSTLYTSSFNTATCYYFLGNDVRRLGLTRFIFWQVDFSFFFILPCCFITFTNAAILRGIASSRHFRQKSSHDIRQAATSCPRSPQTHQLSDEKAGLGTKPDINDRVGTVKLERQERKSLINLLLVSTSYLICLFPSYALTTYALYVYEVYPALIPKDPHHLQTIIYLMGMLDQLMAINYCFNFIIYGCSLPFYRDEAKKLLCLKSNPL